MGLKKPRKKEMAYPWAVYNVEKWEWAIASPKIIETKKVRG